MYHVYERWTVILKIYVQSSVSILALHTAMYDTLLLYRYVVHTLARTRTYIKIQKRKTKTEHDDIKHKKDINNTPFISRGGGGGGKHAENFK